MPQPRNIDIGFPTVTDFLPLAGGILTGLIYPVASQRIKQVTFTRNFEAASGNVDVFAGFAPAMVLFSYKHPTVNMGGIGFASSVGYEMAFTQDDDATIAILRRNTVLKLPSQKGDNRKRQDAAIKTWDANGITLTWTKVSTTAAGVFTINAVFFG